MLVQPNLKDASIMSSTIYSVITGTGSYIPSRRIKNEDFLSNEFLEKDGSKIAKSNQEIIDKLEEISTISERRYVTNDLVTSDIAFFAAEEAIKSANIDKAPTLKPKLMFQNISRGVHDSEHVLSNSLSN